MRYNLHRWRLGCGSVTVAEHRTGTVLDGGFLADSSAPTYSRPRTTPTHNDSDSTRTIGNVNVGKVSDERNEVEKKKE